MSGKFEGKIGSREVFVLITFMISLQLSDMTPNLLFNEGKTSTWMIPIIAAGVMIIPFLALSSLLKKYSDKGLIDIIYATTGRYIGFVISLALFLIVLFGTAVNSRDYVDIVQTIFLPQTPREVIYILLIAGTYFIANRGLENIGRTAWFIFPVLTLILLLLIFMSVREVHLVFLYPIWGPGIPELVKTSVKHSPIVGDVIMFAVLFPYVRSYKDFKTPVLYGLILSAAEMAGFFAMYIASYDYPSVAKVLYPFHQTTILVRAGRYVINFQAFFFIFWIIASVIRYTIYLYLTVAIFASAVRLKEYEPLLLPFSALVVMLGLIPDNLIETVFFYRQNVLLHGTWYIFILLPLALWVISKIRGDKVKCQE